MRQRRLELEVTQFQAASACQMSRSRWSDIERGVRSPRQSELWSIAAFLGIREFLVRPTHRKRYLLAQGARLTPPPMMFKSHQDRSSYVRYCVCRRTYPELTRDLSSLISRRSDSARCWDLAQEISFDSSLEVLNFLTSLASGARPALITPASLGHTPRALVDPKTRREVGYCYQHCLVGSNSVEFFQQCFLVEHTVRVDVLRWNNGWSIVEINGKGHNCAFDEQRASALLLPTSWLTEEDVIERARLVVQSMSSKVA